MKSLSTVVIFSYLFLQSLYLIFNLTILHSFEKCIPGLLIKASVCNNSALEGTCWAWHLGTFGWFRTCNVSCVPTWSEQKFYLSLLSSPLLPFVVGWTHFENSPKIIAVFLSNNLYPLVRSYISLFSSCYILNYKGGHNSKISLISAWEKFTLCYLSHLSAVLYLLSYNTIQRCLLNTVFFVLSFSRIIYIPLSEAFSPSFPTYKGRHIF